MNVIDQNDHIPRYIDAVFSDSFYENVNPGTPVLTVTVSRILDRFSGCFGFNKPLNQNFSLCPSP